MDVDRFGHMEVITDMQIQLLHRPVQDEPEVSQIYYCLFPQQLHGDGLQDLLP